VTVGPAGLGIVDLHDLTSVVLDPPGETLILFPGPFTPDATQVYFNGGDETDPSRAGVYLGSADDPSDAAQILSAEANPIGEPTMFAMDVSPDGTQLVLYQQAPGDDSNTHGWLAISNVDGSDLHRLTPEGVDVPCCVRWSPDGSRILFSDLDGRMLTINPDGSGLTEVFAREGSWVLQPVWSPDGSQIMFALNSTPNPNSPAPNSLYVINADGSGLTPVIETPDYKHMFAWVPDVRD
jgi:Tol biopolymer transport system component